MDQTKVDKAEDQIYELRKIVSYDIRELTIEIIVQKYQSGLEYEEDVDTEEDFFGVIYVPEYQRDFTWDKIRQSRLIESILLGLPIPLVFVAENRNGTWEIVDGSQRIRTLNAFLKNKLKLTGLTKLNRLNGFTFSDLSSSRKSKFVNVPLRMIVLSEHATDEVKKDMFERINRGSDILKPMEKRKGIYLGPFRDFIYDICAKKELFDRLAPIDKWLKKRQEKEELILRFFALADNDNYLKYPRREGIGKYLDNYLEKKNTELNRMNETERDNTLKKYEADFESVLSFAKEYLKYGFRINSQPRTKRVVFEALSVGVYAFLKSESDHKPNENELIAKLNSPNFHRLIRGSKEMHKPGKVRDRVMYVKNAIENS